MLSTAIGSQHLDMAQIVGRLALRLRRRAPMIGADTGMKLYGTAASEGHGMQIAIGLYPGFTSLDAIGPYQVFVAAPKATVVFCAARSGHVSDDHGLTYAVPHTFDEITNPDIVLLPGGTTATTLAQKGDPAIDWARAAHPTTTYTTSVCTGSLLLGAAGLLDGLRATTHWTSYEELRRYGAQPVEERVVREGKIVTAAGVSAGIDMALTLVSTIYGDDVAKAVQLGIEYDPHPPHDSGSPSKATPELRTLVRSAIDDNRAAVSA